MKKLFWAVMAIFLAGCATSGPEYERGAFHQFVAKTSHPLREGIIANHSNHPIFVSIDGSQPKKVSQKFYGFFRVTAKEPHRLVATDNTKAIIYDEIMMVPNDPLGGHYYMPRGKVIDTGWVIDIF